MSEIDIEAVRKALDHAGRSICTHEDTHRGGTIWTICEACGSRWADDRGGFTPSPWPDLLTNALSALDQLAKENEQLKAKLLESGEGANAVDRELGKVMRERDEALSKLAADEAEAETMRKMRDDAQRLGHSDVLDALEALAAMLEAIVEAVRREDERKAQWPGPFRPYITEPLRPHLPTPEPEPVDPLEEAWNAVWQGDYGTEKGLHDLRAALSARGIEIRKIGEDAARQFRSSDNG